MVHSGTPMRLPASSRGARIRSLFTQMKPWRKTREGNTGIATKLRSPAARRVTYSEVDISEAS